MYFRPFQRVNAANTGFPRPKVPIHRKLRLDHHILLTGNGLDIEMIRQGLTALDEKTQ